MIKAQSRCPICTKHLHIKKLKCPACKITMEGDFIFSKLGSLCDEDQNFIEVFVKKRGNIKEVEKILGISYPTVCKKLIQVNKTLEKLS
jgi:hypothetical protein